jgi:signal transduction histidine kinase/CheY-like chemotaxis protein
MNARQKIFRVRRNYNQWVNNQTLEDYALRFTAKKARKWSLFQVANTALGAISFLALEAIGGAITLSFGFDNASLAIITVCSLILLAGFPICYYAAKYGVDIDLLTRGAGFGYIGSTVTSLIYASFTFIFFALEAAILATMLQMIFGLPLPIGYIVCSVVVLPIVAHGITLISRFQLWTQPIWIVLQILPFVWLLSNEWDSIRSWQDYSGSENSNPQTISLVYFGAASAVLFSLVAQIGEQVDYLRFLPEKTNKNALRWWVALISAGPGWIVIGALKIFAGSLLAYIALENGIASEQASDPARMYTIAFEKVFSNPQVALAVAGIFVIVAQLKINVTNAYAGSIAWSNFFSRLTHSHPGRVVWLVFNVAIALMLMEIGLYQAFEDTLGVYGIVAVAWVGALVADLVINKSLGLSPKHIEFRRAYLHDVNPVGVGSMIIGSTIGIACYLEIFGEDLKALAHFVTLASTLVLAPAIAVLTKGRFYIARPTIPLVNESGADTKEHTCCICQNEYEIEDMAWCPAYSGSICSLCCSLDSRCRDMCKKVRKLPELFLDIARFIFPENIVALLSSRFVKFTCLMSIVSLLTAVLLSLVYGNASTGQTDIDNLLSDTLWKVFFVLLITAGVIVWLFVLANESKLVAQEESQRQNRLFMDEIEAHKETDKKLQLAKEKAEAANNAKSRYLTGISHELRTPLNSILGYAQLLENDLDNSESQREKFSVIRRSGEHLADLIEGLLDISKIEAGRLDIHRDYVRIAPLLDQLVYMFRLQAEEKGLQFSYTCHSRLPEFVTTDEKRLRQVLINLLSNAIKFTEKGSVEFSIRYRNHVAELSVKDTGVGIPESEMERIFLPFERVRQPGDPVTSGTGLGLTITRLLTELLGGDIAVTRNSGGGVTFKVWLMLASVVQPESDLHKINRRIYGYRGKRQKVMVVDDDASHRGLISDMLTPLGFIVLEAHDAGSCIQICEDLIPDLFLLDISMPDINGIALAEKLRLAGISAPIVMVSALATAEPENAPTVGETELAPVIYDDYLVKPIKISNLLDKIAFHLRLEWEYEQRDRLSASNANKNEQLKIFDHNDLPGKESLDQLRQFAEIGHLSGLRNKLRQIIIDKEASNAFIDQMKSLIQSVQFERILEILREVEVEDIGYARQAKK